MNQRKLFNNIREIFAVIAAICLLSALGILAKNMKNNDTSMKGPAQVKHRVLLLCSYDPLYFTYDDQMAGIENVLYTNGIEFDVMYMDTKLHSSNEDVTAFYEFFKKRYKDNYIGYEAILLADDDALVFALDHQDELFKDMPMVFYGINDLDLAVKAAENPCITGFFELDYLDETIEEAIRLFPDKKKLVAIHDESTAGATDIARFYSHEKYMPEYEFTDINVEYLNRFGIINLVSHIPDDAIVFYMTCYDDAFGNRHSFYDTTSIIVNNTDSPIFRNYANGRDMGVLGGTYMNFTVQTENAARIISDVLNDGKDISTYKLSTNTPSITEYNYKLLSKYGISEKQLPADTVFVNKPVTLFEIYKNMLPVAVLMGCSLIAFFISMIAALSKERKHVKELETSKHEIYQSQNKLIYQAEHDELIGLYNRRTIMDYLNTTCSKDDIYSVIMIDLDGYKDINENYGHDIGDNLLIKIGNALKTYSDENHMVIGRYGGDEFIMLYKSMWLYEDSEIITGIVKLFHKKFNCDNVSILMSASIGISNSDGETTPAQHVLNAEIAMYEAKNRGKNMVFVFADDMKEKLDEESTIKKIFMNAFENNGFYMVYQPKVSAATRDVIGYEALIRIRNSKYGPGQFIPVIEKSGWTTRLGRLLTELVVKQISEWENAGKTIHPVSINFSSRQVNDTGYCDYLRNLLKKYHVEAKYIQIEITESLLIEESARTNELFEEFKSMGLNLLMDDFGTGYSSLAYLTYVPVDDVKLDKSLVDTYLIEGKEEFIKDVIQLIHDIGKTITIEGVEYEWQYKKLAEFKADTIQGYYFSKPLEADIAIDFKVD